jgi:hypothetical protein
MSKIFPDVLDSSITSDPRRNGEVYVYNCLKEANLFSTTNIYYSVDWLNKKNARNPSWDGECDFIITDSDLGIIFIEVKAGYISKDSNNSWFSNGKPIKNPITQVKNSKYAVINEFKERWKKTGKSERNFSYGHFIIFPNSSRDSISDLGIMASKEIFAFSEDLKWPEKTISRFLDYKPQGESHLVFDKLGEDGQKIFHDMFASEIDFTPSIGKIIEQNKFIIEDLTSKQNELITKSFTDWPRLWIEGPAGSGKTSLAIHKFLKERNNFENPIFICRGKKLSKALCNSIDGLSLQKNICTFDSWIFRMFSQELNQNFQSDTFKAEDRDKIINFIFDASSTVKKFDLIVVDESQDFEESWWSLIESVATENSVVWIFGDSNQNIWSAVKPEIKNLSHSFKLNDVIRNSKQISEKTMLFYDQKGKDISLKGPYATNVEIFSFDTLDLIVKEIERLKNIESVQLSDITILTSHNLFQAVKDKLMKKYPISTDELTDSTIHISTILNFKGLESACVLLLIDDLVSTEEQELYIGLSRAINSLKIFVQKNNYERLLTILNEVSERG